MKWGLVSLESLDTNTEKIEGFYEANNFIISITLGASIFVLCDLKTYFQM